MFKTLKIRLITVFIGFSLLGLIIIVLNNRYDKKKNSINNILSKLNSAQITHLNNQKIFRDYLYIDTRNSNYFSTGKSVYLQKHDSIFKDTQKKINSLLSNPYTKTLKVQEQLNNINKGLDTFYLVTNEIAKDYILKGFKWVDEAADETYHSTFLKLKGIDKVRLIKKISRTDWGESWLSVIMNYILEALLADPQYGGNPEQKGWKWLSHYPGYPRPSAELLYPEILNTLRKDYEQTL